MCRKQNQDEVKKVRAKLRYSTLRTVSSVPLLKLKHLSTELKVKLVLSLRLLFFSFPFYWLLNSGGKPQTQTQLLTFSLSLSYLLFLSFFHALLLILDEIGESSSLNSLSRFVLAY